MTCLIVKGAPRAIDFYKQVFGATELIRHTDPQGHVMHAEIAIGDTRIALADEEGEYNRSPLALGGSPAIMQLRVDDADAVAERAVAAGARLIFPVADQFYGERSGRLADPFGHLWIISTHIEDVSPEELARRAEAYAKERAAAAPAKQSPAPVREGFSSITPFIFADDLPRMVDFMKDAFGAEETLHETVGDPPHTHSEVRVGDSMVMLGDSSQKFPANPSAFHLYVEDADAAYKRALRVGATSMYQPTDQEYGDREAGVKDRFGNHWYIGTHKEGSYIPRGLRSLTMSLHPKGAPKVIDFLKRVFDAEEVFAARDDAGTVHHAKIRIGDAMLEMGEAHGPFQPMPPALYLYVSDVDATYRRALEAGAVSMTEPRDQAYGDRMAAVKDPFGNIWFIATQKKSAA
jgi:PhnB protein